MKIEYYMIMALVGIVSSSLFLPNVYASGCYDRFIFHWFTLNPVLECLDGSTGSGEANTASNIGTHGEGVFSSKVLIDLQFKKLLSANTNLIITSNSTNVIFNNTSTGESTICANLGTVGEGVYVSGNCNFKKLVAGIGTSFSVNGTRITINNSSPDDTTCANVGSGKNIYKDGECNFRSIVDSTGITATQNTDDVTLTSYCTSTGSGEAICESSNNINSLIATSPLSVSDTTGDLTIDCSTCLTTSSGFQELTRASPSDGGITFTTSTFTAKKYLHLELFVKGDATSVTAKNIEMRFNGDTGNNYAYRLAGGTNAGSTSSTIIQSLADEDFVIFFTTNCVNVSASHKLCRGVGTMGGATTNAPSGDTFWNKWSNTSSQITSITIFVSSGGFAFDSTTELVVYGKD